MRYSPQSTCRLASAALAAWALASAPAPLSAHETKVPPPRFANGFPQDPNFFPIGVWVQQPANAAAYRAMGINVYVGIWDPPTRDTLDQLDRHGMSLIVVPSAQARALPNAHVIRGWMQVDEPDNAQPTASGDWGDCIEPEEVVRRRRQMHALDPTRPVFLNFGQAVANPQWFGRGVKCSKTTPEAYYRVAHHGADILSFDIYPAAEERQAHVMGKLELVGLGTANLRRWSKGQPVWTSIETTHINHPSRRPLPDEIRSQVWMAIVHGSAGIHYFVHEWLPSFREDGVLRYPDTVAAVMRINAQVTALAPVLNSPTLEAGARVQAPVAIATLVKRYRGAHYLFAVNMENKPARAALTLHGVSRSHAVVLGEDRFIALQGDAVVDDFPPYGVHLYRIGP